MARLELFRRRRLHQAGPAARADERCAEGSRMGPARRTVLAGRHREDAQCDDAAGRAGGERQRRRPALVAALLVRGLRHPAETGAWGFRLEGHHLTQSISVRDNRIVSVTPSSFSALPNRITSGKHAGLMTLKDEEALARRLAADLAAKPRLRQSDTPLYNIMSYAGRERSMPRRSASRPPTDERHSATCCGSWSRPIRCGSSCRRSPPHKRIACGPAIARPCISPGTGRTRPRRRSAIG